MTFTPSPGNAEPPTPAAPFAAIQWGTNGCIEVGVRPDAPYNQPRPRLAPASFDRLVAYPAFGYDPTGFPETNGTNACRYNFRDTTGSTTVITTAYCVQWARGQRTGTGYDPLPWDGTIANDGYVRRVLADNWPATNLPAVNSTNATVINRLRSGAVAMAVHYFTDGVLMPPNYQDATEYAAVADVVNRAIAAGPMPEPADPRPSIDGPTGGTTGTIAGPYTIGSNATTNVTVTVTGGEAFTDAAGTQPFTSGTAVPPGTQLWLRSATTGTVGVAASATITDPIGTLMVADPANPVQSMALAEPEPLLGKATINVPFDDPPLSPTATSQVSAQLFNPGGTVTDAFTVTGLGASGTATLDVTLYGPSPPGAGGCAGSAWTDVARTFTAVPLVGDQVVETDPTELTASGCYSFGAVVTPTTGTPFTMPPGDPDETFFVTPAAVIVPWRVTSQASSAVVDRGASVRDRITIAGLLTDRALTVRPALFGPVPAVGGSCSGVNWITARPALARVFPTVVQVGNGTVTTPATSLTRPGCYSFAARVTNGFQTGGLIEVPHGYGNPREVVRVLAAGPTLRTRTSDGRVRPGEAFADRVTVSGLPTGATARATARLYGPFSSKAAITCRVGKQVRAVSWQVRNGRSTSPAVRVHAPGVYTWRVTTGRVAGLSAGSHRCGLPAETTTVAKASYRAPAIAGGFSGVLPGYQASRRTPRPVVHATGFRLRARVLPAGVVGGHMKLPGNVHAVSWLSRSAGYRDAIGTTVIGGHVSDRRDRPGAMRHLAAARRGDLVTVGLGARQTRFRVTGTASFGRGKQLPRRYFTTTGPHRLVLVSCTGRVVYPNGHFHYTRYQVVVAQQLPARP